MAKVMSMEIVVDDSEEMVMEPLSLVGDGAEATQPGRALARRLAGVRADVA